MRRVRWRGAAAGLVLALAAGCGAEADAGGSPDAGAPAAPSATAPGTSAALERVRSALPRFVAGADAPRAARAERVERAREAMEQEDGLKRAFHLLRRQLEELPDDDEAAFLTGVIHLRRSNFGAARPWLERILERGPTFAGSEEVFYWYGLCMRRLGDLPAARESLTGHLRLRPGHGRTSLVLGEIALEDGRLDEALAHLEQALDALLTTPGLRPDADVADVHAALGDVRMKRGELAAAEEALRSCLRLRPEAHEAYYKLARVLELRGDREGAAQALAAFERHEPPPPSR